MKVCRTCAKWVPHFTGGREENSYSPGYCHDRSPIAIEDGYRRGEARTIWPKTEYNDFCGYWEQFNEGKTP